MNVYKYFQKVICMSNKELEKPIIFNLSLTKTECVVNSTTIGHEGNSTYGKVCPDYCIVYGGCKAAQIKIM